MRAGLESIGHAEAPSLPEAIGPYRVIQVIGEGAMGVVYEAEQTNPTRRIALKVLRTGRTTDDVMLRTFSREVRALARLDHPAIATIYDAGRTADGQPYFAMQLVEGRPLDRHFGREALDTRACLALLARVADAVHYAHQRGILHRDLKPANILVDDRGDPHVLDFGLAQPLDTDAGLTMSLAGARVVGTLPYMSPEQARGDDVDERSDVYSLGVILYGLVTGIGPYQVPSRLEHAVRVIVEAVPKHPSTVSSVPRDLGDVVMKALEKDLERRYQSALELGEDLQRVLDREPIHARPLPRILRLRRWTQRHPVLTTAIVASLALVMTTVVLLAATLRELTRSQALNIAAASERALETDP